MRTKLIALAFMLLFASQSRATVIDTYPAWTGSITNGWSMTAQTFTAPSDTVLLSYQFQVAPRAGDGTLSFSIYNWAGTAQVGSALYSVTLPWTTTGGSQTVDGINLAVSAGNQYGAVIDLLGYGQASVYFGGDAYTGGNGLWGYGSSWSAFTGLDQTFQAEFADTAATVPEPSTLLLLGAGLAGVGLVRRRSKKA